MPLIPHAQTTDDGSLFYDAKSNINKSEERKKLPEI
jgi:hypothetical protein